MRADAVRPAWFRPAETISTSVRDQSKPALRICVETGVTSKFISRSANSSPGVTAAATRRRRRGVVPVLLVASKATSYIRAATAARCRADAGTIALPSAARRTVTPCCRRELSAAISRGSSRRSRRAPCGATRATGAAEVTGRRGAPSRLAVRTGSTVAPHRRPRLQPEMSYITDTLSLMSRPSASSAFAMPRLGWRMSTT
ncbi:hypothetical protein GCM10027072_54860 [Streptomyces bullii]